jgi:hypothetical protein
MTDNEINSITISGRVRACRYHPDHDRLTFIIATPSGNYFVEMNAPGELRLETGQRVMVMGTLFTVLEKSGDRARIRARSVHGL